MRLSEYKVLNNTLENYGEKQPFFIFKQLLHGSPDIRAVLAKKMTMPGWK
jgi:hypothetical protein